MVEKPLITLENAGRRHGSRWLVRGVDLSVSAGEIVTLIGPNGSGKSTTVKMALGIDQPNEGRADRADNLVVGYVPQRLTIDWTIPLSVSRFMRLIGSVSKEQVKEALAACGVDHLASSEIRLLSGGEFQRVLMARAIARRPNLLVLDEPVQGVDFAGEVALYELIAKLRNDLQCGILMVSHDLHVVMAATDRVMCLNGHVCCSGSPKTVANDPAYQSLFGVRSSGALAIYEHNHDHTHLPDGRVVHNDDALSGHPTTKADACCDGVKSENREHDHAG